MYFKSYFKIKGSEFKSLIGVKNECANTIIKGPSVILQRLNDASKLFYQITQLTKHDFTNFGTHNPTNPDVHISWCKENTNFVYIDESSQKFPKNFLIKIDRMLDSVFIWHQDISNDSVILTCASKPIPNPEIRMVYLKIYEIDIW